MDQIAAMGLKAIAAYKAQLDSAAEQVDVARTLARKIELFEVTIGMIPKRSDEAKLKEMRKKVPGKEEEEEESGEDQELKKITDRQKEAESRSKEDCSGSCGIH